MPPETEPLGTESSTENEKYRPYYILGLPLAVLLCICAITYIVASKEQSFVAIPIVIIALGMLRQTRWVMIWLSTPAEQKILARGLESEPLIRFLRAWLRQLPGGTDTKSPIRPHDEGDDGCGLEDESEPDALRECGQTRAAVQEGGEAR